MKMCGINDMNDLMYDIWTLPDVGLPTYPLGIRPNLAEVCVHLNKVF